MLPASSYKQPFPGWEHRILLWVGCNFGLFVWNLVISKSFPQLTMMFSLQSRNGWHSAVDRLNSVPAKVSAPMTERNPRTAQPPHKITYENSQRNFRYIGHPLVKCDTAFEFAQCAVKGSLDFWDPPVYVWIQFVIAFTNQNIFYFYFFVGEYPTSQWTILQKFKNLSL